MNGEKLRRQLASSPIQYGGVFGMLDMHRRVVDHFPYSAINDSEPIKNILDSSGSVSRTSVIPRCTGRYSVKSAAMVGIDRSARRIFLIPGIYNFHSGAE
jgi:hypothetical protein